MVRDFSEEAKQNLKNMISQVESEKFSNFTDWIGDRWYDFEEWIGKLNIGNYIDNVNGYHKKVLDKNNTTFNDIDKIFNNVNEVNKCYERILGNKENSLTAWQKYMDNLCEFVKPGNGTFNVKSMDDAMQSINSEISGMEIVCLRDQMLQNIGGKPVFNEELIYEYMKKDMAQLSVEERKLLIDVISQMKDTVTVYETLATYGTDEIGTDLSSYVSWIDEDKQFKSYTAVSAHYNEKYVNLLNFISEHSNEENTFAGSIVKISNEEETLSILGVEYSEKLGKIFGGTSFAGYLSKYKSEHSEQYFCKLEESERSSLAASGKKKKYEKKDKIGKTKYFDKDGNTINTNKKPKFYEKEAAIAETGFEKSVSGTVYEGTFDFGEFGETKVEFGSAEAHAEIKGGLYVLNDKNEKIFRPGVQAEIGVSATALEVDWENQWLGDENFGLNTDVDITIGKAEATAEGGFNVIGEDGKLDLQASVGVKAEAIAAEIAGSAGLNVLGGEVGVKGSVNYGIGVHADLGYHDGVFKFDIGASLGIGASVGLEIDVGGMVDSVCDVAESAWSGLKNGFNKLKWW